MKNLIIHIIVVIFILTNLLFPQKNINAEELLKGTEILSTEKYNGKALYGYINGGAEIFLEYGFQELTLVKFVYEKINFKLELYKFADELGALGMLTYSNYGKLKEESQNCFAFISDYQFQINKGKYLVSLISEDKCTEKIKRSIINKVLPKIQHSRIKLPELIRLKENINRIKIIRGNVALENILPALSEKLSGEYLNFIFLSPENINGTSGIYYFFRNSISGENVGNYLKNVFANKSIDLREEKNYLLCFVFNDQKELEVLKKLTDKK